MKTFQHLESSDSVHTLTSRDICVFKIVLANTFRICVVLTSVLATRHVFFYCNVICHCRINIENSFAVI